MQNLNWMTIDMSGAQTRPVTITTPVENYSFQEFATMNDLRIGLPEANQINYATSTTDFISEDSFFCIG